MKRALLSLVAVLCMSSAAHAFPIFGSKHFKDFLCGAGTGAISSALVEYLRHEVLPDITDWQLYNTYGLCRDQLTGESKLLVALAALLGSEELLQHKHSIHFKRLAAKMAGIFTGICASCYIQHQFKNMK